jgi:signal transduction histidine kinase
MFIMISILSMLVFIPMSLVNYHTAKQRIESRTTGEAFSLVNLTLDKIGGSIDNAQNLAFSIAAGESFSMNNKDELIAEYIRNYISNNRLIPETIYYINAAGKVICNRQVYYDIMGNPMLDTLVEKAWDNFGNMSWSQPYHSPLSGTTVAVVYPVENKTRERLGVLIVELALDEIKETLYQLVAKDRTYVLLTSEGRIVALDRTNAMLPLEDGYYFGDFTAETTGLLLNCSVGVSQHKIDDRDLIIVKSQRSRIGWILFNTIDRKKFNADLESLAKIQLSTGILWILLLFFFAVFISYTISKPIRKLITHMTLYRDPESASPIPIFHRDEIGQLADSYNQLLDKIKNLVIEVKETEREKKQYELNMLQNQIQPHFLYNTLACISSLAKQNHIDEVRNTISSLVNLLSFTFDKPLEIVYLTEELEAVKMYIQIQKTRYGDIFDMVFFISDAAKIKKIPKLTLQPVIENTIINSIILKHQPGCIIKLSAVVEGGNLVIKIEDNGIGLKTEMADFPDDYKTNPRALDLYARVGMIDSDKRLKLYYGAEYGISICGDENTPPFVLLTLPA